MNISPRDLHDLIHLLQSGDATFYAYEKLIAAAGGEISAQGIFRNKHYLIVFDGKTNRIERFTDLQSWFVANVLPQLEQVASKQPTSHLNESGDLQCISCGSTHLHTGQRGYSFVYGGIFGSSQIIVTCLNCGQKFRPGGQPY